MNYSLTLHLACRYICSRGHHLRSSSQHHHLLRDGLLHDTTTVLKRLNDFTTNGVEEGEFSDNHITGKASRIQVATAKRSYSVDMQKSGSTVKV